MFDPKTFDYNLLRVFDALAREKSVSGAAESLGLSQPAVSNALQRLRIQLDDPLFVRTRHGMEPTAFALSLQNSVLAGLAEIRAALSQTNVFDPIRSERTFTLLMNDVGAATVLPFVFERFTTEAPKVNIRIIERDHNEYEDALDSAAADIAVGRVSLSESFQSVLIARSPFVAILRSDHPALSYRDGKPYLTREKYLAAKHAVANPRGAARSPLDQTFSALHLTRRIALDIPHAVALIDVLPGSDMIATLPDGCVKVLCRDRRLTWVKLPIRVPANEVYQWWHKRHEHDEGHRWLRSIIAGALQDLPPSTDNRGAT